ncbi:MAG: hypothetical protein GX577_13090 [Leptolinea sp.]|nr:hypothetical protein [Leptolinea sp.]
MKTLKITGIIAITSIILGMLLAACSPAAPATPTTDPGAVYTMAAATVQAQLTQAALANPTAEPPTATPEPSLTPEPTAEPTQEMALQPTAPFAALGPTVPASGLNPNLAPTQSQASSAGFKVGDYAEFQYNLPGDNTVYAPGIPFMGEVGFKNVGSVTWTTDYKFVFVGGAQFSGITTVPLLKAVSPGEKAIFNIAFKSPSTPTKESDNKEGYLSYWRLVNQSGAPVINGDMYFKIIVKRE